MGDAGSIRCPDCHCPLFRGATICPYCHSTAPGRAQRRDSGAWVSLVLLVLVFGVAWYSDHFLGTGYYQALHDLLPRNVGF